MDEVFEDISEIMEHRPDTDLGFSKLARKAREQI